jgi:hypothetical protein
MNLPVKRGKSKTRTVASGEIEHRPVVVDADGQVLCEFTSYMREEEASAVCDYVVALINFKPPEIKVVSRRSGWDRYVARPPSVG